jgi:ABC-type glycerol-3-phosphate transport system substrate-binding protein
MTRRFVHHGRVHHAGSLAAMLAAGAVLAAACSGPPAQPTASTPAAAASTVTASVPAYAVKLQPELEKLAKDLLVTGAVVEVRSPEVGDWTTTIGTRTYHGTDPVQVGDHIRIGSVTKTWTGSSSSSSRRENSNSATR